MARSTTARGVSVMKRLLCGAFAVGLMMVVLSSRAVGAESNQLPAAKPHPVGLDTAKLLTEYFEQMSVAKPLVTRTGDDWQAHQRQLQDFVLDCAGLKPLPERVPLDVHQSEPLDHPWCRVRRVYYQLWPGVYSAGLLFMPKQLRERPAPLILCPHGHWDNGNVHPEVQRRCLNFARLGYITFSSTQNHYEDLAVGVSHQTLAIWNNIRALDFLESLPDADRTRIGVAGASGGGLQAQMLVGLDPRVKAATIVGMTCDFRQIMHPAAAHCACNHFPDVMRRTDHPEISTLGLPAAVQFLTMNDWTRTFEAARFPAIRQLYTAHGVPERVFCKYFDTEHEYGRTKREFTYWWMERWLRGSKVANPEPEPETTPFPVEILAKLSAAVPANKGFAEIGRLYRAARGYRVPSIGTLAEWQAYRTRMTGRLKGLLGESAVLERKTSPVLQLWPETQAAVAAPLVSESQVAVEHVGYPSEGPLVVPTILLRRAAATVRLPVTIVLAAGGKESLLAETGKDSPRALAGQGSLVVLPDVRTCGAMFSTGGKDDAAQRQAWERNGIVWGRPVPGMAATDLRAVLDGVAQRPDADMERVAVIARGSSDLAIAALFAAALDDRIRTADLDFTGACFEKRNLPLVPCVLQHGDVLQLSALLADRRLTLRRVPPEAGDAAWLRRVFAVAGDGGRLIVAP